MNRVAVERIVVGVLVAGFAIGTLTHVLALLNRGWTVNSSAPVWMNVYWTSLTFLDPLAALLLLRSRRTGLMLASAIMLSDVAINTYASYLFGFTGVPFQVQLQTVFLGFLLGAVGFLAITHDAREVGQ